jgi:hypothetical protein
VTKVENLKEKLQIFEKVLICETLRIEMKVGLSIYFVSGNFWAEVVVGVDLGGVQVVGWWGKMKLVASIIFL